MVVAGLALAACASPASEIAESTTAASQGTGPVTLVRAAKGVAALRAGASRPIWQNESAIAAHDGSAVVGVTGSGSGSQLVAIDPSTGTATFWAALGSPLKVAVVAPDAKFVAVTDRSTTYGPDRGRRSTAIRIFDDDNGNRSVRANLNVPGDVEPEAFSKDGTWLFVLNHRGDSYRVQQINLATGERIDVSDRDKTIQAETMNGQPVHAVLDRHRNLLATLYRDPNNSTHPAFVHILDLEHVWSSCVDLEDPFGAGSPDAETIRVTEKNTVIIGGEGISKTAEIRIEDVLKGGSNPVLVELYDRVTLRNDDLFRGWAGFRRTIAPLK